MELKIGNLYRDEYGNILSVVHTNFNSHRWYGNEKLSIVICKNQGNIPTWHATNWGAMEFGSMLRGNIVERIGISQLPIFIKVNNMQGEKIDYLVNYKSKYNTHLGIVHTINGDAIRCFYENGEIETPIYDKTKEGISARLLNF